MVEYPFVVSLVATGSLTPTSSTTTTTAALTTTSTTTTSTTTTSTTATTVPASLVQDADSAVATGGFASDGTGKGNTNGSGDNWDGADATDSSLTFTFTVTTAGEYRIRGSIRAPSGGDNSFWVTVDGEPGDGYLWDTTQSGSYTNDYVSDRDGDDPVTIWLEPGEHTVGLHLREDGTDAQSRDLVPV